MLVEGRLLCLPICRKLVIVEYVNKRTTIREIRKFGLQLINCFMNVHEGR